MKPFIKTAATLAFAALLIPSVASAATLTNAQISAILGVLQSFGVDQATVARVEDALHGTTSPVPPAPSCSITASAASVTAGASFTVTWNSSNIGTPILSINDGTIRYAVAGTSGTSTWTAGPVAKQYVFTLGYDATGTAPFSPVCSVTVQKTASTAY